MENQKQNSSASAIWVIVAFIAVAIAGILITAQIANGSTSIGVIGGLVTLAIAFLSARWLHNKIV